MAQERSDSKPISEREPVVDLAEFGRRVSPQHRALKGLIKDTLDVFSALNDFKLAAEFAARSAAFQEPGTYSVDEPAAEECSMALLGSAIVFYGRAAKNTSKHRKTFDLRKHFDEVEQENHDLICRLRDDAIAHYGPGELPDNALLRVDKAFMVKRTGQLLFISRSISGSLPLANVVRAQSQRALIIAQRLHEERQEELLDVLHAEVPNDGSLWAAWKQSITDLSEGMGDASAAEKLAGRPPAGIHRISGRTAAPAKRAPPRS
jgi:hypothetical protein